MDRPSDSWSNIFGAWLLRWPYNRHKENEIRIGRDDLSSTSAPTNIHNTLSARAHEKHRRANSAPYFRKQESDHEYPCEYQTISEAEMDEFDDEFYN